MDGKVCSQCGVEFFKKSRFSLKWWKNAKYCSWTCSGKSKVGKPGGMRGKKHKLETIEKIRSNRHTEEAKRKVGLASKGNKYRLGTKQTEEWKRKNGERMRGERNPRWIKDRTIAMEKHRLRGTQEWTTWRSAVFERDMYTCQECGDSGVYLEPHHITPLKVDIKKVFDVNNGITLCRPCHKLTMGKEMDFVEKYYAKLIAQV